jgi:streptogramin lyase
MRRRTALGPLFVVALTLAVFGVTLAATPASATYNILEYPVLTAGAHPSGLALGPDGNVWFTEEYANQIGRITMAGVVSEFPIPTPQSGPLGIAAGPDGNLWFTESFSNKIGRITTAGTVTGEFPTITANGTPSGITAGSDGRLWFTETDGNRIGRISTSGVVKEFKISTPSSGPFGITAAPDGALWFTESQVDLIGRITTTGTISQNGGLASGSVPDGITTGPDGALWFTELLGGAIGRMTTSGVLTNEYPIPTGDSFPNAISVGPDGNLWFTEGDVFHSNVGQMTTTGSAIEFPTPTAGSEPEGIWPGADGNMWFSESANLPNAVGTISLPHLNLTNVFYIPNRFFIPNIAPVGNQGDTITWEMLNPGLHGVFDASGMGLFGSRVAVPIGSLYSFRFTAAGSYSYEDPFRASARGTVRVPIQVSLVPGTTNQAQVQWSSADPPAGFVFDVQVRQPGSRDFVDWRPGVLGATGVFGPSDPLYVGPGTYAYRARIRNVTNGASSGYSSAASIGLH